MKLKLDRAAWVTLAVAMLGGCGAPDDAEALSGSATPVVQEVGVDSASLTAAEAFASLVGDYIQFIDFVDLSIFNTSRVDYMSLTLRQDGTFDAVVTARRADQPGHQVEVIRGGRFAAEQGTWSALPPANVSVFNPAYGKSTLIIRPVGQPERRYLVVPSTSTASPLKYEEIVPTGVLGGRSTSLYRAAFFANSPPTTYRICLGGTVAVATPTGPVCQAP